MLILLLPTILCINYSSSNNNIRITQMLDRLRYHYGKYGGDDDDDDDDDDDNNNNF